MFRVLFRSHGHVMSNNNLDPGKKVLFQLIIKYIIKSFKFIILHLFIHKYYKKYQELVKLNRETNTTIAQWYVKSSGLQ